MQLTVLNQIFSGRLVQALCWMLVHSLWLGLALTVLTGAIIVATKNKTAALRYNLLSGALLLFSIAVVTAFIMQLTKDATVNATSAISGSFIIAGNSSGVFDVKDNTTGFTNTLVNFFNNNAAFVVWCWFLIIAFRCVQFAGGLYKIKQIKTMQLTPVSSYWNQRLTHFAKVLKIKGNIQFMQSGLAKMPMVVGHFKPVILFPIGLLTALPAEEVEAVLLHELAHIRRKDYLVNLLQHFTEILFFFNPAVLWVSSLIKAERENCCDDIAVAHAGNKRNYINALVSFQEYHLQNTMQYATALGNNKNQLLQRVKRMLHNNNKTLNNMEKTFLAVCFAATTSLVILFSTATTAQTNKPSANNTVSDTTGSIANKKYNAADFEEGSRTIIDENRKGVTHKLFIYKKNGILYEVYDDMASFKIDGKSIPQSEWGKYQKLLDELKAGYESDQQDVIASKLQQEKLSAERLELLALLDKLKAEQVTQPGTDTTKAEREMMELLAKLDMLKNQQQQLANEDKFKAEQLALTAQLEKLKAEQQQLVTGNDKLTKNKQQLQDDFSKMKAERELLLTEQNNGNNKLQFKEDALQKTQLELDLKGEKLKIIGEKKQMEMDMEKQKAEERQMKVEQEKEVQEQKQAAGEQKQVTKDQRKAAKEQKKAAAEQRKAAKEQARENEKQ